MKLFIRIVITLTAALLFGGVAGAQTGKALPGQNYYYDDQVWPLPADGAMTTFRLTGMTSVHAVWMTFNRYDGGKPVTDHPIIPLLEGSTAKWTAPGGCAFVLELVNANPPVINMRRPSAMCSLLPDAKAVFKILAAP